MADNSELDKMRLAAMMNKSPATGGLKATNTVTPSFGMSTPIEQAYSRWKQGTSIAARQLRGEQLSADDVFKDLNYQLENLTKNPTNLLGTTAIENAGAKFLNLSPRLTADKLRGPDIQPAKNFMQQMKQLPGTTKEGFKMGSMGLSFLHPDSLMRKEEFVNHIMKPRYQKVDLGTKDTSDVMEHLYNEAMETVQPIDVWNRMGIHGDLASHARDLLDYNVKMSEIPEAAASLLKAKGFDDLNALNDAYFDTRDAMIHEYANDMLANHTANMKGDYRYKDYQRLVPKEMDHKYNNYFEVGLTHGSQRQPYKHYAGSNDPAGLVGHVRGTHIGESTPLSTGSMSELWAEPGSTIVEEVQADAQKNADQVGHLHQIHGTLTKAAIQHALENRSNTIYIPTSRAIGAVRHSPGGEYGAIYDTQVVNEAINPLKGKPGIKITEPVQTPYSYPWTNDVKSDAFNILGLPRSQHEAAETFMSAPTGGVDRLNNKIQNLQNSVDKNEAYLRSGESSFDELCKQNLEKDIPKLKAHQDFLNFITEKFPEQTEFPYYTPEQQLQDHISKVRNQRHIETEAVHKSTNEFPYYKIEVTPETSNSIISGEGQTAPGYKKGGTVDQDKMNYAVHMAGGGQPNEKTSYPQQFADLAGLDEEYRNANTIPFQHYPKSTEHNGPADAMRHMLFSAQVTKNYNPLLAKILSQGHERLLDWGQPDVEQAMDFHNDAIGREIGAKAQSIEEMTQMAKDAISSGRAKVIGHEVPGKYYQLGGSVKNLSTNTQKLSTNTGNHGNIAFTTAQMRANLMRKKHG